MFITSETRDVRLPAELAGKAKIMPWRDYCMKLYHACEELNRRGDISLTIHLNRPEFDQAMAEIEKFCRDSHALGANAGNLAASQYKSCIIAGVTLTHDSVGFV